MTGQHLLGRLAHQLGRAVPAQLVAGDLIGHEPVDGRGVTCTGGGATGAGGGT